MNKVLVSLKTFWWSKRFIEVDSSIGVATTVASFASEIILRKGSEEQKEKVFISLNKE